MKLLVIDSSNEEDKDYNDTLYSYIERKCDYERFHHKDATKTKALSADFQGILITGIPKLYPITVLNECIERFAWLETLEIPLLGICHGHEVIGGIFGGSFIIDKEGEDGKVKVKIVKEDKIFQNVENTFNAEQSHMFSVKLPPTFDILASSEVCPNQIMKHRKKPIYGMQFHPELNTSTQNLLNNFIGICLQ